MAEPEPGIVSLPAPSRRHRRRARANRRRRVVVTVVVTVLVVAGVAAFATDTVRFGGNQPRLARAIAPSPTTTSAPSTTLPSRPCRAPLTVDDPLRVWVGGDSLAGSLGPALGTIAGATGVVQPYFHSRVSSGLSNPQFVDWPAQAAKEMTSYSPEVAVFIIGTNDYTAALDTTTDPATGQPAWKEKYAQEVEQMLQVLIGDGRTVLWLGAPVLRDDTKNTAVQAVNEVAKSVVSRHPEAEWFDTYSFFADADGKYESTLTDATGKTVLARAGDGIHFTTDGANMLARAVFQQIDAQCGIAAQAVSGVTKPTIETPGSTQVIGGTSGGSGSGSGSGRPLQTTPPATAPVTTAAPAPATTPTDTTPTTTTAPTPSQPPA
jgi:hypothetical protein